MFYLYCCVSRNQTEIASLDGRRIKENFIRYSFVVLGFHDMMMMI